MSSASTSSALFIVDGYNAIRRVAHLREPELKRGLEAGRRALVGRILESGVLQLAKVLILFDGEVGAGSMAAALGTGPHKNLTVRFAPHADDAIVEAVVRARKREGVTVVTADRELSWRVKELGATVVGPETWRALMPRRRKPPSAVAPADPSAASEKPRASKAEVDYWLSIFGEDEE